MALTFRPKNNVFRLDTSSDKKRGLIGFPEEIQARIYAYALVEPLRWDKTHNVSCEYVPVKAKVMEPPPFALTHVIIHDLGRRIKTTAACSCAKRKALSLLLACTAINRIATPIFWSKNTFCFLDPSELTAAVEHNLRPECREAIRSLSVINSEPAGLHRYFHNAATPQNALDKFWITLKKCKSLQKLELSPALLYPDLAVPVHMYLNLIIDSIPSLCNVSQTFLLPIYETPTGHEYPIPYWTEDWYHQLVYIKCSRRLTSFREGYWTADDLMDEFRDFMYNHRVHVDTAFKTTFLGADINNLAEYVKTWRIMPGLDENSNVRKLTLPENQTTVVKVYGLPPSAKKRSARIRSIRAENLSLEVRPDGQRTAHYHAKQQAGERRMNQRETELREEWLVHQVILRSREIRRLEMKLQEEEAAREQRAEERARRSNQTRENRRG